MESIFANFISKQNNITQANKTVLRRLREDDPSLTQLNIDSGNDDDVLFTLIGNHWSDFGELGECIGRNTNLKALNIYIILTDNQQDEEFPYGRELSADNPRMKQAQAFFKGLQSNTSVQSLHLHAPGCNTFGLLNPFLKHNNNLTEFVIDECHEYYKWWDDFISALRDCVSLTCIKIRYMDLEGEESGEIFQVLNQHQPKLEVLEFPGNQLTRRSGEGEEALTNLLCDSTHIHTLNLCRNGINDNALETLMPQLGKLRNLDLSGNMISITTNGFKAIATLLEDSSCNLEELNLEGNNIQNERVHIFARAIAENTKLKSLILSGNSVSDAGWDLFSDVVCDTSSINNTYNSNHTLRQLIKDVSIENRDALPGHIEQYLTLNKQHDDKKKVAAIKIMQYHWRNLTMRPFFEWELKCLPVAVNWFDNVPSFPRPRCEIEMSKLRAIYEFVRGMPVECADGYFGRNKKGSKKRARSE